MAYFGASFEVSAVGTGTAGVVGAGTAGVVGVGFGATSWAVTMTAQLSSVQRLVTDFITYYPSLIFWI
jgi:hypothetical protein